MIGVGCMVRAGCGDARCVMVAACEFDELAFRSILRKDDTVVAVDGGFASLESCGVVPSMAIGDFDSLGFVPPIDGILRYPCEKDASDLELALDWAIGEGFGEIAVFGALGGRLDQTMATIQTLYGVSLRGVKVFAVGADCCVAIVTGGLPGDCAAGVLELPAGLSGTVSVFSLCDVSSGVGESGLAYGLEDAELTNDCSLGLSNEFTGAPSRISVKRGSLAVFLPKSAAPYL